MPTFRHFWEVLWARTIVNNVSLYYTYLQVVLVVLWARTVVNRVSLYYTYLQVVLVSVEDSCQ